MKFENIIRFSGLLEKIVPLLEEAGFEVTAIDEHTERSPVGTFKKLTGEFNIRIIPKAEEVPPQKS